MNNIQIRVTKDKVSIENENYLINTGEFHVNKCKFSFSDDYTDNLIKKAVFENGNDRIEVVISSDECDIPYEILGYDYFNLRVYAYEVNNNELIIRYSPTPTILYLRDGSYVGSNEVITPSQFEQYEQKLNDGLDAISEKITEADNLDIDVSKEGKVATVSITKQDGTSKSVEINDGEDGSDYVITQSDYENIAEIVEDNISIPTKLSDLTDDLGSSPIHSHEQYLTEHQDISGKVDKETGKGLSSNDFNNTYKTNVDDNTTARHTHSNKSVLDDITLNDINSWNGKAEISDIPTIPTTLSSFTDDLGSSPTHTHSQYITSYSETDPTVPNYVKNISQNDITSWTNKQDAITIATSSDVDALFGTSLDDDGVYLLKTSAWVNPYCFVWNDSQQVAYVDWSGEAMVDTGYTYHNYHIYKYTYPTNLYDRCIFSNHGANQTRDLIAQAGKCYDSTTNQWLDITVYPVVTNSKIISLGDLKEYNDKIQNIIGDIESLLSEV